jgi:cytidyltransferase-like protein
MIAFFPGKFQPPHLGHVLTIVGLLDKYNKVIIGVTDDTPKILEQSDRVSIFKKIFKYTDSIEVIPIQGILTQYTQQDIFLLPDFDICISGNKDVIDNLKLLGIYSEFSERSKGIGYSGTEIRSLIDE